LQTGYDYKRDERQVGHRVSYEFHQWLIHELTNLFINWKIILKVEKKKNEKQKEKPLFWVQSCK
jgi:hypothetical protein